MLEICIDGVASARAAAEGGADRVELCANLSEGGTTPSAGMIQAVRAAFPGQMMVLIRPRGYDFLYDDEEMAIMLQDIQIVRNLGADGVVVGCLTPAGRVDHLKCRRLLDAAGALDVTFHRAFDMTRDLGEALEDIARLGIRRILTSGGAADVTAGLERIAVLARQSAGRVSIMPGGGVTGENLAEVVGSTGVREIHLSARDTVESSMTFRNPSCAMGVFSAANEYAWRQTSARKVRLARRALDSALANPPGTPR